MPKKESNFTQEITLPSHGLLNSEIPDGKIVQRCMMVTDQKYLSSANVPAGVALKELLNRTTTSPEHFNVSNLTLADTLFMIFKLRQLSYGDRYKFKTICPVCGHKIDVSLDLSTLEVESLDADYQERLVTTLPHRGDIVYTKLLTNRDTDEIEKELKRRLKKNPNDDSEYVLRIVYSIEKIELINPNKDGKKELTHPLDIEVYVNQLTDLDASAIIYARDSVKYGVAPTVDYVCPECEEDIEVSVQFSSKFFRPQFDV